MTTLLTILFTIAFAATCVMFVLYFLFERDE